MKSNKYVMSFDMLDLALLPTNFNSRFNNNCLPLWTVNNINLNTNDYFEFELNSKTDAAEINVNERSSNYGNQQYHQKQSNPLLANEDTEMTICYICNIKVSTAYMIDHETSLKHKAYVKIADVVLDRARRHMLKNSTGYIQRNYNMYFCGPCATIIQIADKFSHEKTISHKQSVSFDRLLYELVAVYTDGEKEYVEESSLVIDKKNIIDPITESDSHIDDNTIVISDMTTRLDELQMNTSEYFMKKIAEYDKDNSYILSCIGDDFKISMKDSCEVIVTADNFNGFLRFSKTFILCVVCKVVLENEKAHKISDTHIKNITTPFKDQHCIRKLDNFSSHCVICNKIVDNHEIHVSCDENHVELLQKALVVNKDQSHTHIETDVTVLNGIVNNSGLQTFCNETNEIRLENPVTDNKGKVNETILNVDIFNSPVTTTEISDNIYYCSICKLKIPMNCLESHNKGSKHAMNSKSNVHYIMREEEGSSDLLCRVCGVYVENDTNHIKNHIATSEHCHKYNEVLSTNYLIQEKNSFYCFPCVVVMEKMNELYHIEKQSHKNKLASYNEIAPEIQTVNQNDVSESDKTETKSHNKSHCYICDLCNVHIPNGTYNMRIHYDGARHKKNVSKINVAEMDLMAKIYSVAPSSYMHYQIGSTANQQQLMCNVCKVLLPNNENNILEHITGKKHESSLDIIMDTNSIEREDEKYFCKSCKCYINIDNLLIHIKQTHHIAQMTLEPKQDIENKFEAPDSQATSNINNDNEHHNSTSNIDVNTESKDMFLQYKHHFIEKEDKEWLICRICFDLDVRKTVIDVANHLTNQTHLKKYKDMISNNLLLEMDDRSYFCAVCMCLIPFKGEIHHAKGLRHTDNYVNATNKEHCDLCNITMFGMSMEHHITLPDHITRIMKNQTLIHYCIHCKALVQKDKAEDHINNCHKLAVKDKIYFWATCYPSLFNG